MDRPRVQDTENVDCIVCGGNLEQQTVNICACERLPAVIVRDVPALVCNRCGEKVLSQDVMDIFALIGRGNSPPPSIEVSHVYDYDTATTFSHHVSQTVLFTGDVVMADMWQAGTNDAKNTSADIHIPASARV